MIFQLSMQNTPNHVLVNMSKQSFQDYSLHHLPRGQGKADWLVVHCVLLLALLEDRSDISFFPVLRNLF